ncbi:MAG: DNA-binding protein [Candidatus Chloroheliales bacterium]|nr:MAG: DNA-binding protein [Chloroflexota bacterium]
MNVLTAEWVAKAEGDYGSALREMRDPQDSNYDASCYHSQQSAEKYLKAYLQENNVAFPKIHDLRKLLRRCLRVDGSFSVPRSVVKQLDEYELRFRYPGDDATLVEAEAGYRAATQIRDVVRSKLGI